METFDVIADTYKKLRKLQDQQVEARLAATGTLSPAQERRYKQLKEELITAVKSLALNQNRIDALVEQLYDINKRLVQNEGRLLRLAESHNVKREDFLQQYQGAELDPNWMKSISNLTGKGWKEFSAPKRTPSRPFAGKSRTSPPRPAFRFPNSAASCTWCRRANAKRALPRRKWSRPTFAW